nr:MAG: ADP-ribose pyrophosphatase [Candidatus Nanosalinarum sp. J07AB56]
MSEQALAGTHSDTHRTVRVIISDGNNVLVGRKRSKDRLQPCTGHVEEGETAKEAAVREAKEEMLDSEPNKEALSKVEDGIVREAECRHTQNGSLRHEYTIYGLEVQEPVLDVDEEEFSSLEWRRIDQLVQDHESGKDRLTQNSYKDIKKYREWRKHS